MADKNTLLSFIARRHTIGLEDVATNALSFILSRSDSARQALAEFLGGDSGPLTVAEAKSWGVDAFGAKPDLACFDEDGAPVALVESKFWAPLTQHQPVTYWKALPNDRPAVLLILAPASRIDQGSLWGELEERLRDAGHELCPGDEGEGLVAATAKADRRRLMLAGWDLLLDRTAERTKRDGDAQACFEIAELQGLVRAATEGDNPRGDENLKQLIADAVKRLEQSGWVNTDGLTVGRGFGYYGRYLLIAGAAAWLGIDYELLKQSPDRPLCLSFGDFATASVSTEVVRSRLGGLAEPGLEWRGEETSVAVAFPAGVDRQAALEAIVADLEGIAKCIDPDGPTYRQAH